MPIKDQAAESFGAEGSFLSAGKKLIDVKHPAFKAVSSVKNKAVRYFREVSLPYPEAGIRLFRPDRLDEVNRQMEAFREDVGDVGAGRAGRGHPRRAGAGLRLHRRAATHYRIAQPIRMQIPSPKRRGEFPDSL